MADLVSLSKMPLTLACSRHSNYGQGITCPPNLAPSVAGGAEARRLALRWGSLPATDRVSEFFHFLCHVSLGVKNGRIT